MLPLKLRLKLLNKLAQAVPGAPASPASPSSPASPASTTSPTSTTDQATVQPPPSFNVASGAWAWITGVYNPATIRYLTIIFSMLNNAMQYSTNGKFNLAKDQNNVANLDPSGVGSTDGKNIILLTQSFYKTFINSGNTFKPTAAQINGWATTIGNSQPLLNLSQLSPTGPLAQQMKLSDSFRQTLLNNLDYIKQNNPVQPQQKQ